MVAILTEEAEETKHVEQKYYILGRAKKNYKIIFYEKTDFHSSSYLIIVLKNTTSVDGTKYTCVETLII